jgi:hypothetical protein
VFVCHVMSAVAALPTFVTLTSLAIDQRRRYAMTLNAARRSQQIEVESEIVKPEIINKWN